MNIDFQVLLFILLLALVLQAIWMLTDYRPLIERITWSLKPNTFIYSIQVLLGGILLIFSSLYFHLPHSQFDVFFRIVGLNIVILGFIIAVWAKLVMKKSWGMPAQTNDLQEKKLITNGPFTFSRNPIYLALILFALGSCIALRSFFIILIIFPILRFYRAAIIEEAILEKRFGKSYLKYKKITRRFI